MFLNDPSIYRFAAFKGWKVECQGEERENADDDCWLYDVSLSPPLMIRFTLSHDQNMQIPGAGMRVVPRTADVFCWGFIWW